MSRTVRICAKWLVTVAIIYWMMVGMFYALESAVGYVRVCEGGAESFDKGLTDKGRVVVAIAQDSDLFVSGTGLAALLAIIALSVLELRGRQVPATAVCSWAAVVCLGILLWLFALVVIPLVRTSPRDVSRPSACLGSPDRVPCSRAVAKACDNRAGCHAFALSRKHALTAPPSPVRGDRQ